MSTALLVLANVFGGLIFLFFLWRRLKEDYPSSKIFSLGFFVIGAILVSFLVSALFIIPNITKVYFFDPKGLWFWLALVSASIVLAVSLLRLKMRFFEGVEAASLGLSFWFVVLLISSALIFKLIPAILYGVVVAALIFMFFFLDKRYKRFTWYKSGKVGFSGLTLLAVFFLVRAAIAIIDPTMLSFIGKIDALISSVLSFLFFLSVYNLGGLND
ncbi:MAG TPA: hypothetical protein VF185_00075 [Patescibacteria group bacterium]